jgi:1-acyl-sn-glycerol-3-phosphate acyltransferase
MAKKKTAPLSRKPAKRTSTKPPRASKPPTARRNKASLPPAITEAIESAARNKPNDDAPPDSEATPTPRAGAPIRKSKRPPPAPVSEPVDVDVAASIRELEAKLDRMIDEASQKNLPDAPDSDTDAELEMETRRTIPVPRASAATSPSGPPSSRTLQQLQTEGAAVFDTARELLSTDYYLRKWGRLSMRGRSEEVDDFGYDPVYEERFRPFFNFLYSTYFRVETDGIEHIPAAGRCLLVANHSGTLPYDGVMLKTALKREHPQHRDVRWLAEDFIFHFPFLGSFTNRIGAVRACQENAERLLRQDALVAVFPEGTKGIGKLFKERYRLQRFGRGGFIKLCLRTKTPIVPCAIIGAEETNPMLFRIEAFSRSLGIPYIPVTPTFPVLGPLGLAPAPTKWKIIFGELISLEEHGPEAAEDDILVTQLAERVRASIQSMVDRAVGARRSIWFG